ncbi:MAG: NUDIX domain-containing protein [Deinococcota bacterium]
MRAAIKQEVQSIHPVDDLETEHQHSVLTWIASDVPLCRTAKPATPAQHLVSYFVVVDVANKMLLLGHHTKANLWLPTGGHVEPDEHPRAAALREANEELGVTPEFLLETPLMLTVTETVGNTTQHTDVSLWYVMHGQASQPLQYDVNEFSDMQWFALNDVPLDTSDPHMARFLDKLHKILTA